MKKYLVMGAMFLLLCSFGQLKYQLPDVRLKAKRLCGKKICDPGSVGMLLHLTDAPYSPELNDKATNVKDIVLQVVGKTLPSAELRSSLNFNNCPGMNFTQNDISELRFQGGKSLDYRYSEVLEINVDASTEANLEKLRVLTQDADKIARLKVKIQAAYQTVKGKKLVMTGRYSEWGLNASARERVLSNVSGDPCRAFVQDGNERMILAVGLIYYDITFDQNSVDELASQIDAELEREGITGSLSFTFKKEITESFSTKSTVYQVVIMRHAGINNNRFLETF